MSELDALLDPFNREHGSGSSSYSDDWLELNSIYDNEWGSQAATTFDPNDFDGYNQPLPKRRREFYERLYRLNNGYGEGSRHHTIKRSRIWNDTEMFMSVLDMPQTQRQIVREVVASYDMSSRASGGHPYEKIILAICSLVADEALTEQRNPSVDDRLFLTDEFRELMDVTAMSTSDHRRIRARVREQSPYFNESI